LKKGSSNKDADDDYPKYANGSKDEADGNRYSNSNGGRDDYSSGGYNSGGVVLGGAPYYGGGGGGGYGNSSPYSGGGGYGNSAPYGGGYGTGGDGGYAPYSNVPAGYWAHQDGTRSPLYINTREVHVYGAPAGYGDHDSHNNDEKRRGGFLGPAFHAVGHFFDRKFGFSDRD
ncbi:hypothetical protein BAE44_0018491, partial [Dichanthelium oligosanthes]